MSIKAIETALAGNRMVLLAAQKAHDTESPKPTDIFETGTVGMIMRMLKLPDERIKILVQGLTKAKIIDYLQSDPFYSVRIQPYPASQEQASSLETEAVIRTAKEGLDRVASLGEKCSCRTSWWSSKIWMNLVAWRDIIISNLGLKVDITQEILEIDDPVARLKRVTEILSKEVEVLSMQQKIQADAKGEIDKTQREYFLREQLKAIQKELGGTG